MSGARLRVLIAGGGTGGHIMPGLAVIEQARRGQAAPAAGWLGWVGDPRRLETQLVPRRGVPLFGLGLGRPRPRQPRWWLQALARALSCWRLLALRRPHVVVALGGYPAALPAFLAACRRVPVVLLESNALPGKSNRWLARLARVAVVHFPDAARFFPRCRVVASGNPLSAAITPRRRGAAASPTLLVMGGSLAAVTINEAALALAPQLAQAGWRVIHLAGEAHAAAARAAWQAAGVTAKVIGFCHDMPRVYARADVVLARAGASSCAEFALAGLGAVLVPLPSAAEDHQTVNAQALAARGAALVVPQGAGGAEFHARLGEELAALAGAPARLAAMGARAQALARPHAAAAAWRVISAVAGRRAA